MRDEYAWISRVTLDRLEARFRRQLPTGVRFGESELHRIAGALVLEMSCFVLAENLPPETVTQSRRVEFATPATWRDHWKVAHAETWYGKWIATIWPPKIAVETRQVTFTVDLKRYRIYPHASVRIPELGTPVEVHHVNQSFTVKPWT